LYCFYCKTIRMEKSHRPIPLLSGSLAFLVALFIIGVAYPNTDRVVVDQSIVPPRIYLQPQPVLVLGILCATLAPVLCIFILGRRWWLAEVLAWLVLALLLALSA
jgi:hypothetical protein